ncbi:hypothetical protein [Algibacter pacificus]|uniref:hypothetical protein n=1 Tax=Algibacter pacificus TaxID=2599389 RepID=UPI0011CC348C|nr:hypothetical protein [Algibacter pacificus]
MKNIINNAKKLVIFTTICASLMVHANTIKKEVIKTSLIVNNVKAGNQVTILDNNGSILYKEFIESNGIYKKGFDLTALPNGEYAFEINKDFEINTIPFSVNNNRVVFNKDKEETIFKPFIREKNNIVYISKLAPNYASLKIDVYANYNGVFELLHTDKVEHTQTIEKIYKLEKGNYKITIHSDNKVYTKFINN